MMNCTDYRRSLLEDPRDGRPEMLAHAGSCRQCADDTERARAFEDRLGRALRVDFRAANDARASVVPLRPRTAQLRRGWLAAAASVLLGSAIAAALWIASPGQSVAAAVVSHMTEEPDAWATTRVPVPAPVLNEVLRKSHIRMTSGESIVSYANSCSFRGHAVPHLVVQTDRGPVTVMVLVHEVVRGRVKFDEHGYRGVIVPMPGHGSVAVLERGDGVGMDTVESVARSVEDAIVWTP